MIRDATQADLPGILAIYNDAILNTTAVYDYHPHTMEERRDWFDRKMADGFPVIVLEERGQLLGFATFGPFRPRPAYKYTVEHSIYVHKDYRGKGAGTRLMQRLIDIANEMEYATMVGGIDSQNQASIVMHEKLGFTGCGTVRKAGYKFGRWLDLVFYQYQLRGPAEPKEG